MLEQIAICQSRNDRPKWSLILRASLAISFAALLFGFVSPLVRASNLPPMTLALGRVLFAALLLAPLAFARARKPSPRLSTSVSVAASGLLHAGTVVVFFFACKRIHPALATMLLFGAVVYLPTLSIVLTGERPRASALSALLFALVGAVVVCWPNVTSTPYVKLGYAAGAFSGVLMALTLFVSKRLRSRVGAEALAFWQQTIASIALLPVAETSLLLALPAKELLLIAALGSVCTALPFVLLIRALPLLSAQRASALLLLELVPPVGLAPLCGWEVAPLQIAGATLIVAASVIVSVFASDDRPG